MEEVKTPEVEGPEEKPENKIEKKRNWKKILIIFGIIFVIVMTGGYIYSNNPAFCGSCHELQVAYDTWKSSTHRNVHCVDCHSEPGLFNKVKGKFERFYYGYAHLTDIYSKPIKIKVPISNEACETCHTRNRVVSPGGDLVVPHEHHIAEVGLRCSDCHSNLHISAEEAGKTTSSLTGPGFYHPLCWTECHNGI
ncbi:MAG: NapC/NirT family cytochrome c, partial [Actinomycetia bacterium]|nr:NapC/NirT family cytochrome c [Actinomycetes bacterium]